MANAKSNEFWAISALFHPRDNPYRFANFSRFAQSLNRQGVPLLTIQCLGPTESSDLTECADVITVRCAHRLWQKERLLNIALEKLPQDCRYVAWLDADVLFEDSAWITKSSEALTSCQVVQPYSEVVHLNRGQIAIDTTTPAAARSFSSLIAAQPQLVRASFEQHGHTGFAWVARRSFLDEVRLYDRAIVGGGDHLMAHAFSGSADAACVSRLVGIDTPLRRDFAKWAERIRLSAGVERPAVRGRLVHQWHGTLEARKYSARNRDLALLGFDPTSELRRNRDGCWEWANPLTAPAHLVENYFVGRANADRHGQ